jgi:mannan endo-1,4-beta-mannosidase
VYNDTILDGLDYFMAELKKRDMLAVLYLNNSWEWSGGYGQYLEWAGEGECPHPSEAGYSAFMKHVAGFATNKKAQNMFYKHVKNIMKRTNRYTGVKYVDDPTIMSWQIGNEPRAFTKDYSVDQAPQRAAFAAWLAKTSKLMKKLDKNQMVSTGSEGKHGCEEDMALFEKVHADKNVDYICIHIWPFNWGWIKAEKDGNGNVPGTKGGWIGAEAAKDSTKAYLDEALVVAKRLQKPIVIEEFGFPRDHGAYAIGSETTARDSYYKCVFDLVKDPSRPLVAGCNFWAWGGWAKPTHEIWKPYDPYTGDPAQEAQGLNSVFVSDKTVWVIKKANEE